LSPGAISDIGYVYAAVEEESPKELRIDRLLILDAKRKPLALVGKPIWLNVDTQNELGIKGALALIACQGRLEAMKKVYPDNIFPLDLEQFNAVLEECEA